MPKAKITPRTVNRRQFLSLAAVAALSAAKSGQVIIDTHLEVWTFDPRFPFHHPEHPELKRVDIEAPIENEVTEMREYGLKYAVLINPRYYGWDNSYISYSLRKFPGLFVGHGLLNPLGDDPAGRLRYWMEEHGFQGMRFSPIYDPHSSWLNAKALYPLWREAERLGAVFNFYILPQQMPMLEDMAGRFPRNQNRRGSPRQARPERSRSLGRLSQDVPAETLSPGLGQRFGALRNLVDETIPVSRYLSVLQGDL